MPSVAVRVASPGRPGQAVAKNPPKPTCPPTPPPAARAASPVAKATVFLPQTSKGPGPASGGAPMQVDSPASSHTPRRVPPPVKTVGAAAAEPPQAYSPRGVLVPPPRGSVALAVGVETRMTGTAAEIAAAHAAERAERAAAAAAAAITAVGLSVPAELLRGGRSGETWFGSPAAQAGEARNANRSRSAARSPAAPPPRPAAAPIHQGRWTPSLRPPAADRAGVGASSSSSGAMPSRSWRSDLGAPAEAPAGTVAPVPGPTWDRYEPSYVAPPPAAPGAKGGRGKGGRPPRGGRNQGRGLNADGTIDV